MSETRMHYATNGHLCAECRRYTPDPDRANCGWCDHEQYEAFNIEGCYAFERLPDQAPTVLPAREACLSAARDAVVGGREVAYGSPEDNFARIARLWVAYLHNKTGQEIAVNEIDVALMLDLVKTARLQHNPGHVDSWVDKAGYSACGCEIGGAGMNARHKKTGNIYRVVGMSADTTNGREDQDAMVYTDELRLYHRDLAEFSEKFELVDCDDEPRLPCDVALPPAMVIGKGCKMSTLFTAMQRRKESGEGLVFSGRIERLVGEHLEQIDLMTRLAQITGSEMDAQWPDAMEVAG